MEPRENYYARSHEYVHLDGDVALIGISNYAQKELGDVVFVELPQAGSTVEVGDELGSIESVKAVSELFVPVSGEVIEVNDHLTEKPDLVNSDPYGDGWMVKIRMTDKSELEQLMSAEDYDDYIKSES
ncbi:MAG: glycine cleavage system protein GcvH [Thermoanaerobaculia bacterium]